MSVRNQEMQTENKVEVSTQIGKGQEKETDTQAEERQSEKF